MKKEQIMQIAEICHGLNKAICEANQDFSQKDWADAEAWQKDSAVNGVIFALDNPNAPASSQHDAWMQDKIDNGWVYGEIKDADKKTHPCIVPFENLTAEHKCKDYVFKAAVKLVSAVI